MDAVAGRDAIVDWLDREGSGPRLGQLQTARLAGLAPALLGLPDPDRLLRATAAWCRSPSPTCRCELPEIEDYQPQGQLAAGRGRGLGQHHAARAAAAPRAARPTRWTRSSTRAGTTCATATPATTRRRGTGGCWRLDAGRPVHRRRRARDPAPDVLALLRQGAGRHGAARRPGAVPGAVHPGHDPRPRRQQDVELEGQRDRPEPDRRALRRRRRALLRAVHGPARAGRRVVGHRHRGRLQVPVAACGGWARTGRSAERARRHRRAAGRPVPRATR